MSVHLGEPRAGASNPALRATLPNGWRIARLGQLGEVNRGRSRHRPRYADHLYGGPYPFIQTGDIKASGGRITKHEQTYSEAGLAQSRLWPAGTMVITIAANIADTAILTYPACFPDSVIGFIADERHADVRFVEYLFRGLKRSIQTEYQGTGSAQDNLNLEVLGRIEFMFPPLAEQRAIAGVLGALDDKIEANRRMNATLEALARALFKSWFVDFDPVRAKMARSDECATNQEDSRAPALAPDLAALFPACLTDSPLGPIPEGWEAVTVGDVCKSIFSGGTPSTTEPTFWDGEIPWLSSGETRSSLIIDTERFITPEGVSGSSTRAARRGSTVIAGAGQGHTRGQTSLLMLDAYVNQSVVVLEADCEKISDVFLYCDLERRYDYFRQISDGHSSRGSLTTKLLAGVEAVLPSRAVVTRFDDIAAPVFSRIESAQRESRTLAQLRDLLLPKLLSGALRVRDAERMIGDAA